MKKIDKIEKEIKEVEEEINNYIHSMSDIKAPTDKEFNKHKRKIKAEVISSNYFMGVTISSDIVYDVVFKYVIGNIIYRSKMQTLNNYNVGDKVDIYYYKKDPSYIKEINIEEDPIDFITIKILTFIILLVIASIILVNFYY